MITEFVLAWEKNKKNLETYLRNHKQSEYSEYKDLVKLLFGIVINPEIERNYYCSDTTFDTGDLLVIDDGDYQGTQVFVLHKDRYQPSVDDYVYTNVYYGSCSGCDTLQNIQRYDYDKCPSETQLKEYMTLCMHLLQKCKWMYDEDPEPTYIENFDKAEHCLMRIEDIINAGGSVETIKEEINKYFEGEEK